MWCDRTPTDASAASLRWVDSCSGPVGDAVLPLLLVDVASPSRKAGLYRFVVAMSAAQNAAYGSTLSPPRLQQLKECFNSYREGITMEQDAVFMLFAPLIAKQLCVDTSVPGNLEKMYKDIADCSILANKGERVPWLGVANSPSLIEGA